MTRVMKENNPSNMGKSLRHMGFVDVRIRDKNNVKELCNSLSLDVFDSSKIQVALLYGLAEVNVSGNC